MNQTHIRMNTQDCLTPEQKRKLQQAFHEEEYPEIREVILILLLLNDGKTPQDITEFLGCSLTKVKYWYLYGDADSVYEFTRYLKQTKSLN